MMNRIIRFVLLTFFIGISTTSLAGTNQDVGTVVGGIAGGIIGNNLGHGNGAATIGGAVLGGLVGNQLGASADRSYYHSHYYRPGYYRYRQWVGPYPYRYRRPYAYRTTTLVGPRGRVYKQVCVNRYGNHIYRTVYNYRPAPRRIIVY